jgi:AraC-like DNA-binding protein
MRGDDPWMTPDPLGEALHFLRMSGTFYCRSEVTGRWGMTLPPIPGSMWFHVVLRGSARIAVPGVPARTLAEGDFALVPHGAGHVLAADESAAVDAPIVYDIPHDYVSDRYAVLHHGDPGDATTMICGAVRFDHPSADRLVRLLPPLIDVESAPGPRFIWMRSTLQLIAEEARELRPGGEAVITRLSDILVIQALRSWLENDPAARTGWLGALQDAQIGRALALIHDDPQRDWTVAALAAEAAMSRSAFAARFTELVDEPAMRYVTRWRMQTALQTLRDADVTVAELARRYGYQSEAAFSRAFKRVVGIPPGSVRRMASTPLEVAG